MIFTFRALLRHWKTFALLAGLVSALAACNFTTEPPTPTIESLITPTDADASLTPELTLTPSMTPSPRPTVERVQLVSPTPSGTPQPPPDTETPVPTPGPYEHRVEAGEALFGIIQRYGYTDGRVIDAMRDINPNFNPDTLQVGQVLLIPRMTMTPTPPNYEATVSMMGTLGIPLPDQLSANTEVECHEVREGETIIDIAEEYQTTLEIISRLNPEIPFRGCDFNNRSGGEGCNVLLQINQCVQVPLPTVTPTLSPTPSGNETATPTPTYPAPMLISPPNGATMLGPVIAQWISVRPLASDEYYYVEVNDLTAGRQFTQVTRDTSLVLPNELIPSDGQVHDFSWQVAVVRRNAGGGYGIIGGVIGTRGFRWQSR
jgi:LysM repeat protein